MARFSGRSRTPLWAGCPCDQVSIKVWCESAGGPHLPPVSKQQGWHHRAGRGPAEGAEGDAAGTPRRPRLQQYRDYLGSHLDILDLETLRRRIVLSTAKSIQAPNWTRDGKALIYNSEGRLYRFDLAYSSIREIPFGEHHGGTTWKPHT
jgi:hypothetical protein